MLIILMSAICLQGKSRLGARSCHGFFTEASQACSVGMVTPHYKMTHCSLQRGAGATLLVGEHEQTSGTQRATRQTAWSCNCLVTFPFLRHRNAKSERPCEGQRRKRSPFIPLSGPPRENLHGPLLKWDKEDCVQDSCDSGGRPNSTRSKTGAAGGGQPTGSLSGRTGTYRSAFKGASMKNLTGRQGRGWGGGCPLTRLSEVLAERGSAGQGRGLMAERVSGESD